MNERTPVSMSHDHPQIAAAYLRSHFTLLVDRVTHRRKPLVIINKRGKPLVKLVPVSESADIFGHMAGMIEICGDIVSPIDVEWTGDAENI